MVSKAEEPAGQLHPRWSCPAFTAPCARLRDGSLVEAEQQREEIAFVDRAKDRVRSGRMAVHHQDPNCVQMLYLSGHYQRQRKGTWRALSPRRACGECDLESVEE